MIGRIATWTGIAVASAAVALLGYGVSGYVSARTDADELGARADRLIAEGRGADDLGAGRVEQLLMVEDPGFFEHGGVDVESAGGGLTTLTQSLGKRVGFAHFEPGLPKIRLIGYAMGLEHSLSKPQILALFLDTVDMGRGPDGRMTGFFAASEMVYGRAPAELDEREFLSLVAVPLAPTTYRVAQPDAKLAQRIDRIERLVSRECRPDDLRDVWLEGCAVNR